MGGQIFEELKQQFIEKMQGCVCMRTQMVFDNVFLLEINRQVVYITVCLSTVEALDLSGPWSQ